MTGPTRVPGAELERIKRDVSIVQLVEARGVKLSGSGDNLMGLCPFHDDRSPSLCISPSKNVFHCLGACQRGGSVIDFVMLAERVSFRLAVEMLLNNMAALVAVGPQSKARTKLEPLTTRSEADGDLLHRVVEHYIAAYRAGPEAKSYVEARGLDDAEMIEHFKLGYANRTLGYRLPLKTSREGAELRGQLVRLGVLRESGHELMSGSLVVPVLSEKGEVLEMYGRKLRDNLREGTPLHLYLPARSDGRRGVFNLAGLRGQREVWLCEALLDALTVWRAGFRNVTSAYGVEGFTAEMRTALLELGVKRVLVAYDRDDAGDRAAEKVARDLGGAGLEVFRVLFPRGMDANEYALSVQPASKAFEAVLRGARRLAGSAPMTVPEAIEESSETSALELVEVASAPETTSEAASAPATLDAVSSSMPVDVSNQETAVDVDAHRETKNEIDASIVVNEPTNDEVRAEVAASSSSATPTAGALPALALLALLGSDVKSTEDELRVTLGDRAWRVRGLAKRTTYDFAAREHSHPARGVVLSRHGGAEPCTPARGVRAGHGGRAEDRGGDDQVGPGEDLGPPRVDDRGAGRRPGEAGTTGDDGGRARRGDGAAHRSEPPRPHPRRLRSRRRRRRGDQQADRVPRSDVEEAGVAAGGRDPVLQRRR